MKTQELWPCGPVYGDEGAFPLSTDSILLADFASRANPRHGLDLGCGAGILSLLLLIRYPGLRMSCLELSASALERAELNMRSNGLAERCEFIVGDLREAKRLLPAGAFDLVIANPPYFSVESGIVSPHPGRDTARSELGCTLNELCEAAAWALRSGGRFSLVYRPERLSELICLLSAHGLEPKRLRFAAKTAASAPSLLLLEARRDGRPGLNVEPPLILAGEDGGDSDELRRIYHKEAKKEPLD